MLKHKDLPAAKQRLINATNYDDLYAALTDCCDILGYHYDRSTSIRSNIERAKRGGMPHVAEIFNIAYGKFEVWLSADIAAVEESEGGL
jgi:hypothetical protein